MFVVWTVVIVVGVVFVVLSHVTVVFRRVSSSIARISTAYQIPTTQGVFPGSNPAVLVLVQLKHLYRIRIGGRIHLRKASSQSHYNNTRANPRPNFLPVEGFSVRLLVGS